jgi:hypothetical protein
VRLHADGVDAGIRPTPARHFHERFVGVLLLVVDYIIGLRSIATVAILVVATAARIVRAVRLVVPFLFLVSSLPLFFPLNHYSSAFITSAPDER